LPLLIKGEDGLRVKIKLYTVPGQVAHDATRKAVLMRADGVVFVADSQTDQTINNFESFDNLEKNVGRVGLNFDSLPLVVQFNKRDLDNIFDEEEIRQRWGTTGVPIIFSSALRGTGVAKTFRQALKGIYQSLCRQQAPLLKSRLTERNFLSIAPSEIETYHAQNN
jgi:hypothetical protein